MADENKNTNGTIIKTEFADYSQYTPGNIDPEKDLPNLESGESLSKSLGKTKRWIEIFQEGGGGGGGEATIMTPGEGINIRGMGTYSSPKIITNTGVFSVETPTAADETTVGDKDGFIKIIKKVVSLQGVVSDEATFVKPKGLNTAALRDVITIIPYQTPSQAEGDKLVTLLAVYNALLNKVNTSASINNKQLTADVVLDGADITLAGYTKAIAEAGILETDTINTAFGKVQKALDLRLKYANIDTAMPVNPTDTKVPSTKLFRTELDKKLTGIRDSESLTDDNSHFPTSSLVKRLLDNLPQESDQNVQQVNTVQNNNLRVLLSNVANDSEEIAGVKKSANLRFNPFTGVLMAQKFSGDGSTLINIINAINVINGTKQTELTPLPGTSQIGLVAGDNVTLVADQVHGTIRINAAGGGGGGGGGEDGRGIVSIEKTSTSGLVDTYTILYTDGTESTYEVTNGAPGPQGPAGTDGAQGPTGETGPQGPKGDDGADGRGIVSITKTGTLGLVDTYTITYTDGTTSTYTITNGKDGSGGGGGGGEDGRGIVSITKTDTEGLVDTYTILYTDGTTSTFSVTNGAPGATGQQGPKGEDGDEGPQGPKGDTGNGIKSITKTGTSGLVDTYTITFTDNTTTTFTITNGQDGQDGQDGEQGPEGPQGPAGADGNDGQDGADGRGIVSITKTGTLGLVDTYTILYTDETTSTFSVTNGKDGEGGGGGSGGDGRGIVSITKTGTEGLVDTYSILYTDQTVSTFTVTNGANGTNGTDGQDGQDGEDGVGITSITKTGTAGLVDTYTITFSNGTSSTFTVTNGADGQDGAAGTNGTDGKDGRGISKIEKSGTVGLVDTYTITYTDSTTQTFNITNGADGQQGPAGQDGNDGANGNDGKGIVSIQKTSSSGLVDTYTITYTTGDPSTFEVTNGADGANGNDGNDGDDGNGISSITKTSTAGLIDTYTITFTDGTSTTFTVTNGQNGTNGTDGANGIGITNISKTSTSGLEDTYTITYSDGNTDTFVVTNGADGQDGQTGQTGATGNGISGIAKTATAGLVDTYTVTYTNGNTDTFTVTNGADGQNGTNGTNGTDGDDGRGITSIEKTSTSDLVDTYTITYTDNTTSTFTVTNGTGVLYSVFNGSGTGHSSGLVPDPGATAGATKYLREDGTWAVPTSGGGSDPVNRYYANKSYVTRQGNDWFQTVSINPGDSYVFDCGTYTWVQAQTYNSAGSQVSSYGHGPTDRSVSFTAGSTEVSARLGFYPGFNPGTFDEDFANINWAQVTFTKTGETLNDAMTEALCKVDNVTTPVIPQLPATTNITDILANATSASPVTITLMGDSITYGYSADTGKSWAALLKAYIESVYSNVTVNNTGVSGWKSSDAVTNITTALPTGTTIAIAMFGTNNRQTQEHMDALYNDYTTFYERAQSIGAKFIPMCCTAETLVNESISAKYVTDMSNVHRILSKWSKDHNLEMIDLYEGILKYCNYDSDIFDTFFNQTETTTVSGVSYPFHIHPTNDGHYVMYRLIAEALGINAPVEQYTAITGTGGGGAPKYLHRIFLYRKGYYYLSFDLYTSSSDSFQGDTQTVHDALAAEFTAQNFTNFSWRSIPQVTGWYRETSDGTAIPICAIYYANGHFVGVREGVSLTTFVDSTINLSNMEVWDAAPKGTIFDNNIQAIGGGSGGSSIEVSSEAFPCATGYANYSTNSIVFKQGRVVTFAIILTVNTTTSGHALLGTISSEYRPPSTNVLPGAVTYEDATRTSMACTVNVNSDGTVRYYGDTLDTGRHISINGSYLLPS